MFPLYTDFGKKTSEKKKKKIYLFSAGKQGMKASERLHMIFSKKKKKKVGNYWGPCKIDAGAKISPKRSPPERRSLQHGSSSQQAVVRQ